MYVCTGLGHEMALGLRTSCNIYKKKKKKKNSCLSTASKTCEAFTPTAQPSPPNPTPCHNAIPQLLILAGLDSATILQPLQASLSPRPHKSSQLCSQLERQLCSQLERHYMFAFLASALAHVPHCHRQVLLKDAGGSVQQAAAPECPDGH